MSTDANYLPNMPATEDLQYQPNVLSFLKKAFARYLLQTNRLKFKNKTNKEPPWWSVVKDSPCSAGDVGLINRETKIPYSERDN